MQKGIMGRYPIEAWLILRFDVRLSSAKNFSTVESLPGSYMRKWTRIRGEYTLLLSRATLAFYIFLQAPRTILAASIINGS